MITVNGYGIPSTTDVVTYVYAELPADLPFPRWDGEEWVSEESAYQAQAAAEAAAKAVAVQAQRQQAYTNESDPIFFKSQRGEATQQEWLDKIAEIKLRYPM